MADNWRVGRRVPLNVYEGNRPVCQCHTAEDAARIVEAMNKTGQPEPGGLEAFACPLRLLHSEPPGVHAFQSVEGNRFCGFCGGGRLHPIHHQGGTTNAE